MNRLLQDYASVGMTAADLSGSQEKKIGEVEAKADSAWAASGLASAALAKVTESLRNLRADLVPAVEALWSMYGPQIQSPPPPPPSRNWLEVECEACSDASTEDEVEATVEGA